MSELPPRPRVIQGWFSTASGSVPPPTPAASTAAPPPAAPAHEPEDLGATLDLVERARSGDQSAWEVLIARYRPRCSASPAPGWRGSPTG